MAMFMNNVCRLCMTRNSNLVPLFSNDNQSQTISLPDKIMNFVPVIKLFAGDGLPEQICEPCIRLVHTSYKFKAQCEASDTTLRQYLNNHSLQENPNEILHSVFRTDNSNDCWKLAVKNEVVEVSVEPDTDLEDSGGHRLDDIPDRDEEEWPSDHPDDEPVKEDTNAEQRSGSSSKKTSPKVKNSGILSKKTTSDTKSEKAVTNSSTKNAVEKGTSGTSAPSVAKPAKPTKVGNNVKSGSKTDTPKKNSNLSCPQCGKSFTQKGHLVIHMATHNGEKPYLCMQCGKKFARRRQLTVHMFTHTGEKPFLCPICGFCFGRSDTLRKHMRSHTGEKPFHCAVCGKNFGRRSTLTNHMRAHMGEKPYLCTECGWRFVQSYDLTKHMRSHTGEKPFHCTVCRMSFGQRNSLTKHMRSHMGEASFPLDIGKEWQYASFAAHATNPKKDQNGLGGSLQSERLLDAMMSSEKKDSHCPPMGLNRTLQSERLLGAMLPPNEKKDSHCSVGLSNAVGDKDANNRSWRDGYDMLGTSQRWIN